MSERQTDEWVAKTPAEFGSGIRSWYVVSPEGVVCGDGDVDEDCARQIAAEHNACRGLNPEAIPELVAALREIADLCRETEAGTRSYISATAGIESKAKHALAKVSDA